MNSINWSHVAKFFVAAAFFGGAMLIMLLGDHALRQDAIWGALSVPLAIALMGFSAWIVASKTKIPVWIGFLVLALGVVLGLYVLPWVGSWIGFNWHAGFFFRGFGATTALFLCLALFAWWDSIGAWRHRLTANNDARRAARVAASNASGTTTAPAAANPAP